MFGTILCGLGGFLVGYYGIDAVFHRDDPDSVKKALLGLVIVLIGFIIPF